MPTTSSPNYVSVQARPNWGSSVDPLSVNALNQPMVTTNDFIRADHINNLRLVVDIIYNHTHEYHDSVGSC